LRKLEARIGFVALKSLLIVSKFVIRQKLRGWKERGQVLKAGGSVYLKLATNIGVDIRFTSTVDKNYCRDSQVFVVHNELLYD